MNDLTERRIYEEWREWELRRRKLGREVLIRALPEFANQLPRPIPHYDEWVSNGKPDELRFRAAIAAFFPSEYADFLNLIPLRVQ
jgi:hypothetical protein